MRQFKSVVIANCDIYEEKLNYLEQYTTGDAHKIVVGYSYLDAKKGYIAAMKELEERYGDSDVIVDAFLKRILNWPVIKADNIKALDEFAILLCECEHAVQSLEALKVLEYSENFRRIVSKLPYNLHDKWRSLVQDKREHGQKVSFHQLVKFVKKEAKKANDPTFGKDALSYVQKPDHKSKFHHSSRSTSRVHGSFATKGKSVHTETADAQTKVAAYNKSHATKQTGDKPNAFSPPCMHCNGSHSLEACGNISDLPFYSRLDILQAKGCCYGCLRFGHQRKFCKRRAKCCHCQGYHPSILHVEGRIPQRDTVVQNSNESTSEKPKNTNPSIVSAWANKPCETAKPNCGRDVECTMAIIPVKIKLVGSTHSVETYAFIDPGSNISFCSEKLKCQLGAEGKCRKLKMETMGMPCTLQTYELSNLEITDLQGVNSVILPPIYTKESLPVSQSHIPTMSDIQNWPHLCDVELPQIKADVGLLLGNNIPDICAPLEVRIGPRGAPHATRTVLGWIPWNVFREGIDKLNIVNQAEVISIENVQELQSLTDQYFKSVNIDFPEKTIDDKRENSVEDKSFLEMLSGSKIFINGHYEYGLPFKNEPSLPDNKALAIQRLKCLKRKLSLQQSFHEDYNQFMQTLLDKGFCEKVPDNELKRHDGKVWYLPHHGVYHPNKPNKIRVVFDCSAKYHGISLNDVLLQGPNLTNNLTGVLIKFRQDRIAILGDIEKMFYQVNVSKCDRDCLRFYWWPDGELMSDPVVYRMTVHIFGAASSPSCANFALQQTIQDHGHEFDISVVEAAQNNFYVDDFLCSVSSEDKAINMIRDISSLCEKGGFRLTKWLSNSRTVLQAVPVTERSSDVAFLEFDHFPTERALGVIWDVETDMIVFDINIKSHSVTRRNILSTIGSIYDPLGIISPFVLPGRIMLQDLCKRQVTWDEELCDTDCQKWKHWISDLPNLKFIKIPRCFKSDILCDISTIELHHFADASNEGYGIVSYIRFVSMSGQIHCSFLFAKSKVAPSKKVTIPRMELTVATLSVKINSMLIKAVQYQVDNTYFWTDSMAVIRFVRNRSARFKTFVANRIMIIHEGSCVDQWKFINGSNNPADSASRGIQTGNTKQVKRWLEGPEFLWKTKSEWPKDPDELKNCNVVINDDPEIIKSTSAAATEDKDLNLLNDLMSQYSDFFELRRVLGWIILFIKSLKSKVKKVSFDSSQNCQIRLDRRHQLRSKKCQTSLILPMDMLQTADDILIRYSQQQYFSQELKDLKEDGVKKSSSLYKLDPFMKNGIIRVGGRLQSSNLPYTAKHQVILPSNSLLSAIILRNIHVITGHQGKNAMLAKLHEKYWIPRAGVMIKGIISKCVPCRKYQGRCESQKMADLPQDRITEGKKPFSHVGMDYFGPFEVKFGRKTYKRYGVIFTCSTSRAIHLEVCHSLTTDSCINAIRRFVARRGSVELIRSDNGTNLVGAERELRESIENWNQSKIGRTLQQQNIQWIFNPPASSHFGGFWERLIRSIRKVMYSVMKEQVLQLDDEGLSTLMCEVENILNNRPITPVSEDQRDLTTLTPSDLLLTKTVTQIPPGIFDPSDNYVKRRWRQVQYLTNLFWRRWMREYLPMLQRRQKWLKPKRNIKIGDIVLVADNSPRHVWPLARVTEINLDHKGYVRAVTVKTQSSTLQRPIHKLCLILEADG